MKLKPLVPTGHTVLSDIEKAMVDDRLLNFSFTIGTIYVFEEVLKKKLDNWSIVDKQGNARVADIVDMLYAGLYDIDNPESSMTKGEILRAYTPRTAPVINTMMVTVINESSPIPSQEVQKKAKELLEKSDPNSQRP